MGMPTIINNSLIQQVRELRSEGHGTRPIAEKLGISRHTVGKIIRLHLDNAPRGQATVNAGEKDQ